MDTHPVSTDTLLQQLNWRYATKKFDPAKKISTSDWDTLEQALILTPTSYGTQPFRILVVTDPEVRAKLVPASWNQTQPVDCSHFVVLARKLKLTADDIDRYMRRTAEVRGVPVESLEGFRKLLIGDVVDGTRGAIVHEWAAHQAYIALGNLMTSAALLGIDSCPMEGFVPAQYDEILGLPAKGLAATVACAVGYRSAADAYAGFKKVRLPREEMIFHV